MIRIGRRSEERHVVSDYRFLFLSDANDNDDDSSDEGETTATQ